MADVSEVGRRDHGLIPDTDRGEVYREAIEPNLAAGNMLMFAHGFNIRFGTVTLARRRGRHDDRAEIAWPSGPRALRRRRRHAGADRRSPERHRQGQGAGAVVRARASASRARA